MKTKQEIIHTSGTKKVGIWIRVSTEDQARGESPQHHEERARLYAKSKGWDVVELYDLAGVSGKTVVENPETKRMLKDVRSGRITGLIFSKLARLARNTRELLDFSDIFRQHNADLISLQESIDTSTPAGRLFYTMIAAMAQWEREEITDRIKASLTIRAKLGKPTNGRAPYGYVWKDKKLVQHPAEAPIRKRAYELFLEHRRQTVVSDRLNSAGYRTRKGGKWTGVGICRILVCTSAKGTYYYNRMRKVGTWQTELKPETEWGCVSVEPIVPEEVWNQVNRIIEEQAKPQKRQGKRPRHLFAGKTFCTCGARMYVPSNTPKYVCDKCRNKIPVVDLESVFHEELKGFFANPDRIAAKLQEINNGVNEKEKLLTQHKADMQKVRDEMTKTHQLYLAGGIALEAFGSFFNPLQERFSQLQTELPKLEADVDTLKVHTLSAEEVVHEAEDLYKRWPSMVVEDKRKIVDTIVERITIGKDEIDLKLAYVASSEDMSKSQQSLWSQTSASEPRE